MKCGVIWFMLHKLVQKLRARRSAVRRRRIAQPRKDIATRTPLERRFELRRRRCSPHPAPRALAKTEARLGLGRACAVEKALGAGFQGRGATQAWLQMFT